MAGGPKGGHSQLHRSKPGHREVKRLVRDDTACVPGITVLVCVLPALKSGLPALPGLRTYLGELGRIVYQHQGQFP